MAKAARVFFTLAAASVATAAFWSLTGERLLYVSTSPGNEEGYRIEVYAPKRYVYLLHRELRDPGFVRLYNNHRNQLLACSDLADFEGGNGQIMWLMAELGEIHVGRDIVFRNLPPDPK